jgi:hypothetical protein
MLASGVAFLGAAAWGVGFGFPAPDASPAESARLQFHAGISGVLMLLSTGVFAASCALLAWRWVRRKVRSAAPSLPK